jgi:hypothetical protein
MAWNDFRLAAERAEAAAYSADGWLAMGQRGRAAAIYLELRQIDARAVQQLAREIETAPPCSRRGRTYRAAMPVRLAHRLVAFWPSHRRFGSVPLAAYRPAAA